MLLDLVGIFFFLGYAATILLVLVVRAEQLGALAPVSFAFVALISAAVALAVAAANLDLPVPINVVLFTFASATFSAVWILVPAFRRAAAATRLDHLIALHTWRLGGFLFLFLYSAGRLGWPFAPVAAVGDMITGAIAAYFLIRRAHGGELKPGAVAAWNLFGLIDLITAVAIAFLSTPGAPFQIFMDVPKRGAFASLPWLLVPAAIVPALMFVHFAIALNLRTGRSSPGRKRAGAAQ